VISRKRVNQELNNPLLGKPYLKFGQCLGVWAYFFQLGGILGAKYGSSLDAFGHAFLGATGKPGAVERFFTAVANNLAQHSISDSITFNDYVSREFRRRLGYIGTPTEFFMERGMDKLPPETAEELAWQYADQGAALGATYPEILREIFERSHAVVPTEQWALARAAGLNIPAEQTLMSYEETEEGENEVFMAYCKECCPELHVVLSEQPGITARAVGARRDSQTESDLLDIDVRADYPEIGLDVSWVDIVSSLFRVLEFERAGTIIGPNDQVQAVSDSKPYGYLIVRSPLLNQPMRLPIIHRDDFLLAASVFDEPRLADIVNEEELLVTYAPETILPNGMAGGPSHVLHYAIAPRGALSAYYEDPANIANPAPERLLGAFVYDGEIRVRVNLEPEF
jgi:hypothetical protein